MSMMIVAKNKDVTPWIESFKSYNEDLDIQLYPNIEDKEKIHFALVWSKNDVNFQEYPNLKCISSMGAGVEHILKNRSILEDTPVTKIVDTKLVESMWEYLLCTVMNVVTNHYEYIEQKSEAIWKQQTPRGISEYTIGVLGLGQLGSAMAKKFYALGFCVKGFAKSEKQLEGIQTYTKLDESLEGVDILINLLPMTPQTKGVLNKELFHGLKRGAYIINVGRGAHLMEEDLLDAIHSGWIRGATLDVFKKEPLPSESPLWKHPKVIITPHSASITDPVSVSEQIMENYRRVSEGLSPLNAIDKTKGY